jgi:two-component sensor histidine kinase
MTGFESLLPFGPPSQPLILVEEISHRVVNEYTQVIAEIRLAAAETASMEARHVLASAAIRLRKFAEAHRALQAPTSADIGDLGSYLERLCATISSASLDERGVGLTLRTVTVCLPAQRCWRVALIVSELITNAVHHGLKGGQGKVVVEMEYAGLEVCCRVTDNGKAVPNHSPGRGLKIVKTLAAELGGEIQVRFSPNGACVELVFPLISPTSLP